MASSVQGFKYGEGEGSLLPQGSESGRALEGLGLSCPVPPIQPTWVTRCVDTRCAEAAESESWEHDFGGQLQF